MHAEFFKTPMMDEVHSDPAGTTIWGGNARGLWKMIPLADVVNSIVSGIERRAAMIVPSRQNAVAARLPGLIRPVFDRIVLRGNTIPDAIAHVSDRT